jgi:heme/copper-type cytochrome/quinol oxidase subunit 1
MGSQLKNATIEIVFLAGALIYFVLTCFSAGTLDIAFAHVYFVVPIGQIYFLFGVLFTLFALAYFVFKKMTLPLNQVLSWIHVGLTFFGFLGISSIFYLINKQKLREWEDELASEILSNDMDINALATIFPILIVVGLLIFLLNLTRGVIHKLKGR